jgi:hypothetical protein
MSEVFRVKKNKNFTVMSNHHLRNINISLRAKGLLSLMLSLPDTWDYSLAGLSKISKEGTCAVSSILKELEQAGYLIRQRIRNEKGHLAGTEYIIYEKPIIDSPKLENPTLDNLEPELPIPVNPTQSNTNILNKEELNIYQSISPIDTIDRNIVIAVFKENICYDALCHDCEQKCIDELLDILVETYCSTKQTIQISNNILPLESVKGKLMKLTMEHIRYVLFSFSRNTKKVHNIKSYLLACLYNAPSTMSHFYQAEVSHDLFGNHDDSE